MMSEDRQHYQRFSDEELDETEETQCMEIEDVNDLLAFLRARIRLYVDTNIYDPSFFDLVQEYIGNTGLDVFVFEALFSAFESMADERTLHTIMEDAPDGMLSEDLRAMYEARILMLHDDYPGALKKLANVDPECQTYEEDELIRLKAICCAGVGRYEEAAEYLEDLLMEMDPDYIVLMASLMQMRLGNEKQAEEYLNRVLPRLKESDHYWVAAMLISLSLEDLIEHPLFPGLFARQIQAEIDRQKKAAWVENKYEKACYTNDPNVMMQAGQEIVESGYDSLSGLNLWAIGAGQLGNGELKRGLLWKMLDTEWSSMESDVLHREAILKMRALHQLELTPAEQGQAVLGLAATLPANEPALLQLAGYALEHELEWVIPSLQIDGIDAEKLPEYEQLISDCAWCITHLETEDPVTLIARLICYADDLPWAHERKMLGTLFAIEYGMDAYEEIEKQGLGDEAVVLEYQMYAAIELNDPAGFADRLELRLVDLWQVDVAKQQMLFDAMSAELPGGFFDPVRHEIGYLIKHDEEDYDNEWFSTDLLMECQMEALGLNKEELLAPYTDQEDLPGGDRKNMEEEDDDLSESGISDGWLH